MFEEMNNAAMGLNANEAWVLPLVFALFGACIGSFLNVVIYRVPRGLSVNEPSRSFCPTCKAPIPWRHNLPIISWLVLRGRSACCRKPIAIRYWLVEVATALLFAAVGSWFGYEGLLVQILLCLWIAAMLAILCIDWELMAVLPSLAGIAAGLGLLAALEAPWLAEPGALETGDGLAWSIAGALFGFLLLKLVALAGRFMFGHNATKFGSPCNWELRQSGDDILLSIGNEKYLWSELFMETSNRVQLEGATLSSQPGMAPGSLVFTIDSLTLPDGTHIGLESCESLGGTCCGLRTRKEAMGSGDAWIALAIGAACGWQGVLFALAAGSFIGLAWAGVARIGRSQPMPFGPAFIAGAYVWLFFGQQLLNWYFSQIPGL